MAATSEGPAMNTNEAIMAFSQSEKVKAGLIWASQLLEVLSGLHDEQKRGGERIIRPLLGMISQEMGLARVLTGQKVWEGLEIHIEKALIMVDSGVGEEAILHLSRALSQVTNVAQQSMSQLKEAGLL
jgi:hypothetical protein